MSFNNNNYMDKFFSQLSKVGKYVPVKSKKLFGHVVTNPGTEPFYNYIRSILKVTSKFEQLEKCLSNFSDYDNKVGPLALKKLEDERKSYKQDKKNSNNVKSNYYSQLIAHCTSLENFIKALNYDKKNDLIESLNTVKDEIRKIMCGIQRNDIESEAFDFINHKRKIKRNIFKTLSEKLSEFRDTLGKLNEESYEVSLKNSGSKILNLDVAIKTLNEISNDYENEQFNDVKKNFTDNFGEDGKGLLECLSVAFKKIASDLILLKEMRKSISEYINVNIKLSNIKQEYFCQRIILQDELDNVLKELSFSSEKEKELQVALDASYEELDNKLKKLNDIVLSKDDPIFVEIVGVISGL